jgi:hypothetical protein
VVIKDAARLKRALVAAHRGERNLADAIHDYEAGMLDYVTPRPIASRRVLAGRLWLLLRR